MTVRGGQDKWSGTWSGPDINGTWRTFKFEQTNHRWIVFGQDKWTMTELNDVTRPDVCIEKNGQLVSVEGIPVRGAPDVWCERQGDKLIEHWVWPEGREETCTYHLQ